MSSENDDPDKIANVSSRPRPKHPFRTAVFRGLGGFIPPLLTVVIIVWLFGTVQQYVLEPVENATQWMIAKSLSGDIVEDKSLVYNEERINNVVYIRISEESPIYVKEDVYNVVLKIDGKIVTEAYTAWGIYLRYVKIEHLKWYKVIPAFTAIFILLLYFLGKILAGRFGQFLWARIERVIHRVPLVRNVYSSAKQVTEFLFNHQDLKFTRVVAVQYPRKNTWTLGFVTGESFLDIRTVANEPILAVLVPTSPMPVTGFTTTVLKSETIDLNITVDQALEYIVSCGVVVPPHQFHSSLQETSQGEIGKEASLEIKKVGVREGSDS